MKTIEYLGWRIKHQLLAPVTSTWKATRHGVEMCADNEFTLRWMIAGKHHEKRGLV